ncbi:MAG: ATP-dependent DNA helicase RecG [Chitinophagales bacterium]|nr:ATP-dependent DNA helicase RecG [Chitinophagales bacterium]HAE13484.1 ATP-dependent DNA helicase RecG [Bacteroidota bacterium]MCB9021994.1 ATP-dependent DNA helicase RecG [Chitinophagales bacterium]MCB9031723.1 ATP-dependent DNA helicase RecG [Chitinophagales bacterium]HPE96571.1 ATP-dependent DNA helicase RecG [Chitinophagales bacterium]
MSRYLRTPLTYLKGVGENRAKDMAAHMQLQTFGDLLEYFPYRYEDKTTVVRIADIQPDSGAVLLRGTLTHINPAGGVRATRITARLHDSSGSIEVIWFNGISWLKKFLKEGTTYNVYGRPNLFNKKLSISHPEVELAGQEDQGGAGKLEPVYSVPDKLKSKGFSSKLMGKMTKALLDQLHPTDTPECIPTRVLEAFRLTERYSALNRIHHPASQQEADQAIRRLKFEELFVDQVRMLRTRTDRQQKFSGIPFTRIDGLFVRFYEEGLPFELTDAQKKVLREIRKDVVSGHQMNRLLQGDVGSGKTLVALMTMLMAVDNDYQACLMAPTEILARQHMETFTALLAPFDIKVALLTGTVKGKERKEVLAGIADGSIHLLLGTHALIEDTVVFGNLGLVVIDEQHRFGVEQRARMWTKNHQPPHILVMTATPIPRTLSMTYYGDLDVSVIDELPPGRKPIKTVHYAESMRLRMFGFLREQILEGRQVYIVYPLIDESEKLDLNNLMEGYRGLERDFPRPQFTIGMVHGRMPADDKEFEMKRFVEGKTNILVSTTVIEVGVNVPNATVMVIENAERFGLAQLHQLRGRVGRGAHQSFCILMTGEKLSKDGRTRIKTMTSTNDGFVIAEVDMQLRGPGEIEGTRQSGQPLFKLADLRHDVNVLQAARDAAIEVLDTDPLLEQPGQAGLRRHLDDLQSGEKWWGKVS